MKSKFISLSSELEDFKSKNESLKLKVDSMENEKTENIRETEVVITELKNKIQTLTEVKSCIIYYLFYLNLLNQL